MGNNKHVSNTATQAVVTRTLLLLPNFDERRANKFYWKWKHRIKKTVKKIRNTITAKIPAKPSLITLMRQPIFEYFEGSSTATNWRSSSGISSPSLEASPSKRLRSIDGRISDSTLYAASRKSFQRVQTGSCIGSRTATAPASTKAFEHICAQYHTENPRTNVKLNLSAKCQDSGERYATKVLRHASPRIERGNRGQSFTIPKQNKEGCNIRMDIVENRSDITETSASSVSLEPQGSPSDILVNSKSPINKTKSYECNTTTEATTNTVRAWPNAKYFWMTRSSESCENAAQQCEVHSFYPVQTNRICDHSNSRCKTGLNSSTSTSTDFFFKHVLQMRPTLRYIRNQPCSKHSTKCMSRRHDVDSEDLIWGSNSPSITSRSNGHSTRCQPLKHRDRYYVNNYHQIPDQNRCYIQSDFENPAMRDSRSHTQCRNADPKERMHRQEDTQDCLNQPSYQSKYRSNIFCSSAHLKPEQQHVKVLHFKTPQEAYSKIGHKSKKVIVIKRRNGP